MSSWPSPVLSHCEMSPIMIAHGLRSSIKCAILPLLKINYSVEMFL